MSDEHPFLSEDDPRRSVPLDNSNPPLISKIIGVAIVVAIFLPPLVWLSRHLWQWALS